MSALYTALAVTTYSTVKGVKESKKAARAQKKQYAIEQKKSDIKASRARYAAIRQSRIAQAQATQTATVSGVAGSSGLAGGVGSAQTQLAGSVGTSLALQGMSQQQSIFAQQGADAQSNQAMWGAIGGVAGSIFSAGGGFKAAKKGEWSLT